MTSLDLETAQKAARAVSNFRSLLPVFTAYARVLTGNSNIRVVLADEGGPRTDGKLIYLRPPIALGEVLSHTIWLCDKRDGDDLLLCAACRTREGMLIGLYHEIAHNAHGTFVQPSNLSVIKTIKESIKVSGSERAEKMKNMLTNRRWSSYLEMANALDSWLGLIVNVLEDSRIDAQMMSAMPGTKIMHKAMLNEFRKSGIEGLNGTRVFWNEQPLNAQAVIALYYIVADFSANNMLTDEIDVVLGDSKLAEILEPVRSADSVRSVYEASFPVLERLRELGFCLPPEEQKSRQRKEQKEQEQEDQSQESNSDSNADEEGEAQGKSSGDSSSDDQDSSSSPDETGSNEPSSDKTDQENGPADADEQVDAGQDESNEEQEDPSQDGSETDGQDADNEEEGSTDDSEPAESDSEPSDDAGAGEDQGQSGEPDEPDADQEEPDQEPDEDEGDRESGTDPVYGTPEITEEIFKRFTHHASDHDNEEDERQYKELRIEEEAVDRAIVQGICFESPSVNVHGVRIHKFGEPNRNKYGTNSSRAWTKRPSVSLDVSETHLGRALLRMRVAFAKNAAHAKQPNLKAGKIRTNALAKRAPFNDERLFTKRARVTKRDYFVLIGLDISGSTIHGYSPSPGKWETYLELIVKTAYAQAELCHRLGIKFAVYAHTANMEYISYSERVIKGDAICLDIYELKGPEEPWSDDVRNRFKYLKSDSANIDGHTLEFYRKRLDEQQATDKILLYYTDGHMPRENFDEELVILEREIKECRRKNYTLIGVGVGNDDPIKYGLDMVRLDTTEDITRVVDHLQRRLQ